MLFNYIVFNPKKFGKPICITSKGIIPYEKVLKDPTFDGINSVFLSRRKNPFIYFSGTHFIPMLDQLYESDEFKKVRNVPKIDFLFFEPLTHYKVQKKKTFIPHVVQINNYDYETSQLRCAELDSISRWVEKWKIKNLVVYCTDYGSEKHYKDVYKNLKLKFMDVFTVVNSINIVKTNYLKNKISKNVITKKLICPAWRYDIVRHLVISFLAEKDLIKNNNVSFYYNIPNEELKKNIWREWKEFEFQFKEFSKDILNGNKKLQNLVPLSIEIKNPIAMTDPDFNVNTVTTHRPYDSYKETFLSVVLETRVTQPWPNISEKTLNPIYFRRPFIVLGAPNTMKWLKDLGFKTFEKYWDESYDNIWNNDERIVKFCETVEHISKFTIEEMRDMYADMEDILDHNLNNLKYIEKHFKNYNKNIQV